MTSPVCKPLTAEDRPLIRSLRIEKSWAVDRMIVAMFGRSSYADKSSENHGRCPPAKVLNSSWVMITQK